MEMRKRKSDSDLQQPTKTTRAGKNTNKKGTTVCQNSPKTSKAKTKRDPVCSLETSSLNDISNEISPPKKQKTETNKLARKPVKKSTESSSNRPNKTSIINNKEQNNKDKEVLNNRIKKQDLRSSKSRENLNEGKSKESTVSSSESSVKTPTTDSKKSKIEKSSNKSTGSASKGSGRRRTQASLSKSPLAEVSSSSSTVKGPKLAKAQKNIKSVAKVEAKDVSMLNVSELLALGEENTLTQCDYQDHDDEKLLGSSDTESEEWEEVGERKEPVIPKEGVSITLEMPDSMRRKKKKSKAFDLEDQVRKQMNRMKREIQCLIHKVHLLCWLAHLKYVNNILNCHTLMESAVKLVPSKKYYPPKHANISHLELVVKWFTETVSLNEKIKPKESEEELTTVLAKQFESKTAISKNHLVYLFVVVLRTLGLKTRLVVSLQVASLRPPNDVIVAKEKDLKSPKLQNEASTSKQSIDITPKISKRKNAKIEIKEEIKLEECSKHNTSKMEVGSSSDEEVSKHFRTDKLKVVSAKKRTKQGKNVKEDTETIKSAKPKVTAKKLAVTPKNKKVSELIEVSSDTDSDFTSQSIKKKPRKSVDRRVLSSDDDDEPLKKKQGIDVWVEVFLEEEEKWISADIHRKKIHAVSDIHNKATQPVTYVIACNNDQKLKDVTQRYVPHWHSSTRKLRVDEEWWEETMFPYRPPNDAHNREEDEDMMRQLLDRPLPSSISQFKNHPLYVLKRHLLKFEGIYPADAPTLGFIRGEPVYARECVHTLRSREIWHREARVVRLKEDPYKIVKSRPKYDKMTGDWRSDLPLELFGHWQTDEFVPPTAADGMVPRNEYGNVELFKRCMLPYGTVYLEIPGLARVAKKLNIDCVPAVVGFEFHSGACHPVLEGFVVCQEYKDTLLDAWHQDQEETAKRTEEKRNKRVMDNWKKLIRGLLIREKLKLKYSFGMENEECSTSKEECSKRKKGKK